jgi:hypothetical protein
LLSSSSCLGFFTGLHYRHRAFVLVVAPRVLALNRAVSAWRKAQPLDSTLDAAATFAGDPCTLAAGYRLFPSVRGDRLMKMAGALRRVKKSSAPSQ